MSTIRNDEIRLSGMATMCKPFDETNYASLSKIKDVIKPIDTSVLNSVKQISSTLPKYNDDEVTISPCYTVTYSLHSVNSVKLYIYFSSTTDWCDDRMWHFSDRLTPDGWPQAAHPNGTEPIQAPGRDEN